MDPAYEPRPDPRLPTHPDGSRLEYSWEFDDGTPRTPWADGASIEHAYARPGTYSVRVRVQDTLEFEAVRIIRILIVTGTPAVPPQSSPLALDSARRRLWVANPDHNSVSIVHADDLNLVKEIPVGGQPMSVALDRNGNAWVTCRRTDEVRIVSAGTLSVLKTLAFDYGSAPVAVVFTPGGAAAYVSLEGSGKVQRLDAAGMTVTGSLPVGPAPRALSITPDGKTLLVTRFISSDSAGTVWSVDLGIAVDGVSGRVFVQDFLGRTVTVFDAKTLLATGDTVLNKVAAVPVSSREPLADPVLSGKRIFYNARDPRMSLDGYTSCAACHLDGSHDGRTWDFTDRGEGLRNTTTLLGKAGMGHGPLHWSANFDEMQDFEHDMRGPFGGKGSLLVKIIINPLN